jgi:peptidoglycan-associated lipoprotein
MNAISPPISVRSTKPLWAAFMLTSVLAFSGCGPSYPNCENDEHCKKKGEYCLDLKCVSCRTASHCPNAGTDTCVDCVAGACVRKQGCCSNNLDCQGGQKCSDAKCVVECAGDGDCTDGRICNEAGACVRPETAGCSSASDCGAGLECRNGKCINSATGACELVSIGFEFNRSNLTQSAQDSIGANAKCLKEQGVKAVTVEGHCDERGTDAYNLELGNRRAKAVQRYLSQLMRKTKVRTISYGKTQPLCSDAGEGCWSRNRRAEFKGN